MTATQTFFSFLRPRCYALIAPRSVVFDAGGKCQPIVHRRGESSDTLENQLTSAVADLFKLMDDAGYRGRRVWLVVSDYWARPALLHLPNAKASVEETDVSLASYFRNTYGDMADRWHWCWERHGPQLTGVAWPREALAALKVGLEQRACVLASATPMGIELARQLPNGRADCWLLIVTPPCVTLMRLKDGILQDWRVLLGSETRATSLPTQLARESVRRGDSCRAVVIMDFGCGSDIERIHENLLEADWASEVFVTNNLTTSLTGRIYQATLSPKSG